MSPLAPFLAPERDQAFKLGRPRGNSVTNYCVPGAGLSAVSTTPAGTNLDAYEPWYTPTPVLIDQLAAEITTLEAAKNFRMGIYAADTDWQPVGAPLADSGNISTATTGVKTYTPGTPIYVPRGRYLGVLNTDSTACVFRRFDGPVPGGPMNSSLGTNAYLVVLYATRTFAAFPTPGAVWTDQTQVASTTGFRRNIVYRISGP